jgi:hypothetical protein
MFIWLSFCDAHLPAGSQFLGVAIVEVAREGTDEGRVRAAIEKAHLLGINPGGEVMAYECPPLDEERARLYSDRLLQKEELSRWELGEPVIPVRKVSPGIPDSGT